MKLEEKERRWSRAVFLNNADRYFCVDKPKVWQGVPANTHFFCVVGGLSGLHLIDIIKPAFLTLVDVNPIQVEIAKVYIELVKHNKTFNDFWKNYYCRDFGNEILNLPHTPPDPSWKVFEGFNREIPTVGKYLHDAKPTNDTHFRYKKHDKTTHDYDYTYGKIFCLELSERLLYRYHSVTVNPKYPTCGVHQIYRGFGCHSEGGYDRLREWVTSHPIFFKVSDIYALDIPDKSYMYVTNLAGLARQKHEVFCQKNKERIEDCLWIGGDNHRRGKEGSIRDWKDRD